MSGLWLETIAVLAVVAGLMGIAGWLDSRARSKQDLLPRSANDWFRENSSKIIAGPAVSSGSLPRTQGLAGFEIEQQAASGGVGKSTVPVRQPQSAAGPAPRVETSPRPRPATETGSARKRDEHEENLARIEAKLAKPAGVASAVKPADGDMPQYGRKAPVKIVLPKREDSSESKKEAAAPGPADAAAAASATAATAAAASAVARATAAATSTQAARPAAAKAPASQPAPPPSSPPKPVAAPALAEAALRLPAASIGERPAPGPNNTLSAYRPPGAKSLPANPSPVDLAGNVVRIADPIALLRANATKQLQGFAPTGLKLPVKLPTFDVVQTSVFAPPVAPLDMQFLLQVWLHKPEQAGQAEAGAREADSGAGRRKRQTLVAEIARGATVEVELVSPDLEIEPDDRVRTLKWRGEPEACDFVVRVPARIGDGDIFPKVQVSVDGIPAGTVRFKLTTASRAATRSPLSPAHAQGLAPAFTAVGAGSTSPGLAATDMDGRAYTRAFVSYSSRDLDQASLIARGLKLGNPAISYFFDIDSIRDGDDWRARICEYIRECDLFVLVWSNNAKTSVEVEREWQYALLQGELRPDRGPDLCPVTIEGPPVPPPPAELRHLNFRDRLQYIRAAAAAAADRPGSQEPLK